MVTRRSFIAAVCALPFVGRFMPKPSPIPLVMKPMGDVWYSAEYAPPFYPTPMPVPFATLPSNITDMIMFDGHPIVMCSNGRAYIVFEDGTHKEVEPTPRS